jgi:predicted RNase H-like nuclease
MAESGVVTFVGFDSAWADNPKVPGAICSATIAGDRWLEFRPPELVTFDQAFAFIEGCDRADAPTLIALDQPTIVPNDNGMRPVEKVVASVISWMGGGVQPANRGRPFFGPDGPVSQFLAKLGAVEDPEAARAALRGRYLIEVFPALALASLGDGFFGRSAGPRYNPGRRRTFRIEDWRAVVEAVRREATQFHCVSLVDWLEDLRSKAAPIKSDQDRLDAALCLLIAMRWRLASRSESAMLGDLNSGYIVAPVRETVMARLRNEAAHRNVPVDWIR